MKPMYEAPMAIDLAPGMANQSDVNCILCTNGSVNTDGCSVGSHYQKPNCNAGSNAGPICLSGSQQQW
jgi:hypothetical protein